MILLRNISPLRDSRHSHVDVFHILHCCSKQFKKDARSDKYTPMTLRNYNNFVCTCQYPRTNGQFTPKPQNTSYVLHAQQHEHHILIFYIMDRRNCALIMLKRVGGSQDIIRIPNKLL